MRLNSWSIIMLVGLLIIISFGIPNLAQSNSTDLYCNKEYQIQTRNSDESSSENSTLIADFDVSDHYVKPFVDITFDSTNSKPGNGSIINYTWNMDDGNYRYNKMFEYNYSTAGIYTVNLTITNTSNDVAYCEYEIIVDDISPIAKIEFQNDYGDIITVGNENTPKSPFNITFNASKSTDKVNDNIPGKIERYLWDFGVGYYFSNKQIATFSYDHPGIYKVTLNVTDTAGNYNVIIKQIKINDLEAPDPNMITDPVGRFCQIDGWIILNATPTTDNFDDIEDLTFVWDLDAKVDSNNDGIFENDADAFGLIVNYTPTNTGSKLITLWATDEAGNTGNSTAKPPEEWTIDVLGVKTKNKTITETLRIGIPLQIQMGELDFYVMIKSIHFIDGEGRGIDLYINDYSYSMAKGKTYYIDLDNNDEPDLRIKVVKIEENEVVIDFTINDEEEDEEDTGIFGLGKVAGIDLFVIIIIIMIIIIMFIVLALKRKTEEKSMEEFECSSCGKTVTEFDKNCPNCGEILEDD